MSAIASVDSSQTSLGLQNTRPETKAVDGASENAAASAGKKVNVALAAKHQLNISILQASAQVSISAGNQPQALLFQSAIDHINSLLAPELGPDAIQNAAASQDNSAEATAGRILSLSTGFYESYARQHPGEDPEQVAQNFVNVIRKGFEQGYNEAKNILEGLGVFSGEVKSGVEKTFELVQKGYDDFLSKTLEGLKTST
ncbi:MAG: DUF5610 domain-containing protein [Candidatus Accumulibacter sp.]|nr:DUF5610 domain-containing protein [Accumulibacter sp.]